MPYAIKPSGELRAVDEGMPLYPDETYYEDIPQWVYDKIEADRVRAEKVVQEDAWRVAEVEFIANQLLAMEDGDPAALPGTETAWRSYRTKVRNWKEGALNFPNATFRPARPAA